MNHERKIEIELNQKFESLKNSNPIKDLIIDFSCVNLIDSQSVEILVKVKKAILLNKSKNS